jgi:hypothetical protein
MSARHLRKSFRIAADALAVIIILVILAGMILPSMERASWDSRNDYRIDQLRTLYAALLEYKHNEGVWPPDLESVRQRYVELLPRMGRFANHQPDGVSEPYKDYVGWPPLTGPHRVEYYNPPAEGKVLLRSYGHFRTPSGWSRRLVPVTMNVTVDGVVTLGRGGITDFGQRGLSLIEGTLLVRDLRSSDIRAKAWAAGFLYATGAPSGPVSADPEDIGKAAVASVEWLRNQTEAEQRRLARKYAPAAWGTPSSQDPANGWLRVE